MPKRKRKPDPRRRVVELLAGCGPEGCTEARAHTASRSSRMVDLVRAGLATAQEHRVVAGPNEYEVAYLRITQAERQVLAGPEAQ